MTQKQTRAADLEDELTEQPPAGPFPRISMSREEIEAYREKLRTKYHQP
ncbi:hypothetical protein [Nocardia sp. CA-120079]